VGLVDHDELGLLAEEEALTGPGGEIFVRNEGPTRALEIGEGREPGSQVRLELGQEGRGCQVYRPRVAREGREEEGHERLSVAATQ
jgi:hypothetical protein